MDVIDLSWNEVVSKRLNNPFLPKIIRGLIVGKSGCGKTTLLLNLLLRPDWLDYDNLCVFGKSLFQPEYRILKKAFEEKLPKEAILRLFNMRDEVQDKNVSPVALIEKWIETLANKSGIKCSFFETAEDVPDPRELKSENKNLMISMIYFQKSKINASVTIFAEDIVTSIAFTFHKTILGCRGKLFGKTRILSAFFVKIIKTLIIFIAIISAKI